MHRGIMAVWSDITDEARDDYTAWYEREHMFDRLAVPGIRRARHYQTHSGAPGYFTYFITDDAAVMAGDAYLASANNPSPWTQRILPHFRNTNRTVFDVLRRVGHGSGVIALTLRFSRAVDASDAQLAAATQRLAARLPGCIERDGVIAAQLWQADLEATWQPVADRDLRASRDRTCDLALFIDGTGVEPLRTLLDALLDPIGADTAAALQAPECAIHSLLIEADENEPGEI
ncbi:MAG: hypothetical protein KDK91_26165 [Gammaproteobacteria bacterium]|nr:hypothetical protein [Gammaproteobacteria bacterium]